MATPTTVGVSSRPGPGTPLTMDDTPVTPEPPLSDDDRVWLAQLLAETGPDGAYEIADLLGIDLDQ